jgi:hypothetical protein
VNFKLNHSGTTMNTTEKKPKGRGRPATGSNTTTIRIPTPLKPAVEKFVREYRRTIADVHRGATQPPERQP